MSVASLMRSAVGGISSGVTAAAAGVASSPLGRVGSGQRWADTLVTDDLAIPEIQFETFPQDDAESDVEEVVVLSALASPDGAGGYELSNIDRADMGKLSNDVVDGVEAMISTPSSPKTSKADVHSEAAWFSIGSQQHMSGGCKPCAFFHIPPEGCQNGAECIFCHRCPPREKQRRKRVRRRLIREHEQRTGHPAQDDRLLRHSRQGSAGSTMSTGTWETCSTWESGSTVDSGEYKGSIGGGAEYMASLGGGTPSQSSGSFVAPMGHQRQGSEGGASHGMVPVGYVQTVVPVYGVPVESAPTSVAGQDSGGLGYEYLPELHDGKAAAVGSEPGSPTPFTCATPWPETVETVEAEQCEVNPASATVDATASTTSWPTSQQVAPSTIPWHTGGLYNASGQPAGYTLVPVPHYMQQMPTTVRHIAPPQQFQQHFCTPSAASSSSTTWFAPVPVAVPAPAPSMAMWRTPVATPVYHLRGNVRSGQ